jgi:Tol biopolymer transport system component/tetratricopeptide (TPR) repeat protein
VHCVAFHPDGLRIASGSWDQTVKLWYATPSPQLTFRGHDGWVRSVAFSPDGRQVATGSGWPGRVNVLQSWDPVTGEPILSFPDQSAEVFAIAFSPDGHRLASAEPGEATVWDAATGRRLLRLGRGPGKMEEFEGPSLAFSPDGQRLALADDDHSVKVWSTTNRRQLLVLTGHTAHIYGVAFSRDGRKLASAGADKTARVWDAGTGQPLQILEGYTFPVESVAFSPDGRYLASSGGVSQKGGEVIVWDPTTGRLLYRARGHTDLVAGVAFSPDSRRLATASLDRTIKLWDTATGQEVFTLRGHTGCVLCVAFSPDGRRIVSGGLDWTAKVWDLDPIPAETMYRREAMERVEALYKERRDGPAVIHAIEADTMLSAPVRQAAIEIAGRLGDRYTWLNQVGRAYEATKEARELADSRTAALAEILAALERARGLWNDLVAADPDRYDEYRKELALVLVEIGGFQHQAGRGDEADRAFDEAFRLAEGLRRGGWLGRVKMWRDVANGILYWVAIHELSRHRPEKALRVFQERLALLDTLAPEFASNPVRKADVKINQLCDLGYISLLQRATGHTSEDALSSARRAVAIAAEWLQEKPDDVDRLYYWGIALASLAGLEREVGGAVSPEVRTALGELGQRLGRSPDPTAAYVLYDLAQLYSVLSGLGPLDMTVPADRVQRKRTAEADRAMAVLRRAVAAGFKGVDHMRFHRNLDPLRARRDFQELLLDMEFPADPFAR